MGRAIGSVGRRTSSVDGGQVVPPSLAGCVCSLLENYRRKEEAMKKLAMKLMGLGALSIVYILGYHDANASVIPRDGVAPATTTCVSGNGATCSGANYCTADSSSCTAG
jgi:hypothetical protein